jgi:hypothetical protein
METVRNLTVEQARDMINSIDTSLIPECRDFDTYTETDDIWRIGDYGYVDTGVYEQAFRIMRNVTGKPSGRAPCTCLKAIGRPASDSSLRRTISAGCQCWTALDAQFDNGDADNVYLTNGEA